MVLPLPEGEGWGEGEGDARLGTGLGKVHASPESGSSSQVLSLLAEQVREDSLGRPLNRGAGLPG
jgi:hypothetical protein